MSCLICKDILVDYTLTHTEEACPLRASLMCTYCNVSGHSNIGCPKEKAIRRVQVISIRTGQQRPEMTRTCTPHKPALDIRMDDRHISAYLRSQGIQPSQKPKKNLELLRDYTQSVGLVIKKKTPL